MYTFIIVLLFSCAFQLSAQVDSPKSKTMFENIIAFGDSYTDNGSLSKFYKSGSNDISPNSLYPSTSDIRRACDGPLWIEYLADMFKARLFDFARSGSTANNYLIPRYTEDMHTQVETYERTETPRNGSAYFLWTGVNDMTELFLRYPEQRQGRIDIMDAIIESITDDLNTLADSGADHIVLMGLIPLEAANIYNNISVQTNYELRRLVANYNTRLFETMNLFQSDHPNISATYFNTHRVFKKMFDGDKSGVLSRIDCQGGSNCKDLIWWDNLHPTTKTHGIIAKAVFDKLIELQW